MLGKDRPADAIAAYRTALSLDPKNIPALLGLAQALNADGQVDAAIAAYNQAAELAPLPVDSLIRLAALYRKTETYAPAIAALEQAIALRPNCVSSTGGKRATEYAVVTPTITTNAGRMRRMRRS